MKWLPYDDATFKQICYHCGSPVSKAAYNYFRTAFHYSGEKVWAERLGDSAFYFATRGQNHVRLIEIAVREECQGHGLGREVLFRLLSRMKKCGLHKLTFRTPIVEEAANFWLHVGARIVGLKGDDYEMEITIV